MKRMLALVFSALLATVTATAVPADANSQPHVTTLATGIQLANGTTIGPDGALYVTEGATGRIIRVDPESGDTSVYASGLPTAIAPIGGPMDIVFHGNTAYALVSLVGPFFGSPDPSGIYRLDGPDEWTVIADLGQWALDNPPTGDLDYFITTGVHYSIENYRGGFVVADAHHNKVVQVSRSGAITELKEFANTVPSGLEVWGDNILVAMTGPTPHLPEDGQIVSLSASGSTGVVAAGGPLLLDVERGRGATLYGLAQGYFVPGQEAGAPAEPNTGELLVADGDGDFDLVVAGLDRPTSFEIVGTTAYVVGLGGDVIKVEGIGGPPYGRR